MTIATQPGERGIPHDANVTQLHDGEKLPTSSSGHHNNEPWIDFFPLGRNVGIVLDHKFIVIDIDRPDADEARFLERRLNETGTWRQKTPRGKHWLFRIPLGFTPGNGKLVDLNEKSYADIKSLGYIVAPGSEVGGIEYAIENVVDPITAPEWLIAMHVEAVTRARSRVEGPDASRRDQIPAGEHDNALAAILGQVARSSTARLNGPALERIARALVEGAGILEPSTGRPYGPGDYRRLAESALRFGIEKERPEGSIALLTGGLQSAASMDLWAALGHRWWVHGFIPKNDLVTIFAKGGGGKSTACSWVTSEITRKGGSVAVLTVEESFELFAARAVLGGADASRIYAIPNPTAVQFPRDIPLLVTILKSAGIEALYIDSVMSHFSHEQGENAAERGRRVLGPLARMAKEHGITPIAIFHENKAGEFKGATEMVDVARHVIKITRRRNGPPTMRVWKTNLLMPSYDLALYGTDVELVDKATGDPLALDEDEDGNLATAKLTIVERVEKVGQEPDPHVPDDEIEPPVKRTKAKFG